MQKSSCNREGLRVGRTWGGSTLSGEGISAWGGAWKGACRRAGPLGRSGFREFWKGVHLRDKGEPKEYVGSGTGKPEEDTGPGRESRSLAQAFADSSSP
jgi:hypothetical protein